MEGIATKHRQVSPEKPEVSTVKSPKNHYNHHHCNNQQQNNCSKVPVVYYLCRNQNLEHPHFMEVPLSSSDGLYLKDVIERLNILRGRGMASMYSWSCKRSYKNGYVWHDLCEDDLIHPAHGNEFVLKGSELFQESNSGRYSPAGNYTFQNQKALPEPPSSRSHGESSSTKCSQDDNELSPESSIGKNSSANGSLCLTEYKVYESDGLADASTQTAEKSSQLSADVPMDPHSKSTTCKPDTLESLIRADLRKLNKLRTLQEEENGFRMSNVKIKASKMIMQLISCGSVNVKDHSFGLNHAKFPSPLFSTSLILGDFDWKMRSEEKNSRTVGPAASDYGGSKRMAEGPKQSSKIESFRNDGDKSVIKIEERLASGARVIIQSKVSSDSEDNESRKLDYIDGFLPSSCG